MPNRPPKLCTWPPGCSTLVYEDDQSRCIKHRPVYQARPRPSAAKRGYNYEWQEISKQHLKEHPNCADPYHVHKQPVKAKHVDHIIPKRRGGTNAPSNRQSLCHNCHNRKINREDGGGWRATRGRGD